ncbi:Peptidase M24, structural domain protein [Kalmanozyma brasiliensis GHG001]|uniref:Peptidase M24, structural domain protein n=1 Tax=Kalmanozyma brasiliensis (strain GHG001) TaxID=1365824 RepID=UPI002867B11F|nr:Peptidase M24, structural domain protein [Kalmanozyma brasiliensis GHG001]EST07771.2 Peptidase M24, structural domain protein [Kalmanozyma brasiliensis GHG001]
MSPTATTSSDDAAATSSFTFDPFAAVRSFKYSGSVQAVYPLSPKPKIPPSIRRPNYAREGFLESRNIKVNNKNDQEGVRKAATLAREVLEIAASHAKPGVTTDEIDKVVFAEAIKRDCYPSPLGYHGYPKSVCTSINEVICHGIPDQRPLKDGDILNIDVTLFHKGYHGDLNATFPVGAKAEADAESMKLIRVARECLDAAINICGPGIPYGEIGRVIQPLAESQGCAVVKNYTGHGISNCFHAAPTVYHHATKKSFGIMKPGHIFTIEPMLNLGSEWRDLSWPDDWTVATVDGARSAAAEETLLITETGVEILTAKGGPRHIDTTERRKELEEQIRTREERKKRRKLDNGGTSTPASGAATPTPAPEEANATTKSDAGPAVSDK